MRYNIDMMLTTPFLVATLCTLAQSPSAPAPIPVRGPATAITQQVAADEGPIDAVPASSRCATDRRLARTVRYAILKLDGVVGDSDVTDALTEFLKRHSAASSVNTLVIEFNLTGGDHQATMALADQIVQVRKRMPVIGVFGSCSGVGAILPLVCDYLVVLNPTAQGMVLEWSPGCDVADKDIAVEVGQCLDAITTRAADRPYVQAVVKALLDPSLDLFLWRGADGCPQSALTAPSGVTAVQVSSGKDALAGMTGAELVASGLALASTGTIDGIGKVLGVTNWIVQPEVVAKLVKQVRDGREQEYTQMMLGLKTGFTAVKTARALVGGLVEAESNARASDPRKQQYRKTYARNWTNATANATQGSSWQFTRVTSAAWQSNCDYAIQAWEGALKMYVQASSVTAQANAVAATLAKSSLMASDPEFKAEVAILQSEVDALMAQAPALTIKGDNAKQALAWLRKNRLNPAM